MVQEYVYIRGWEKDYCPCLVVGAKSKEILSLSCPSPGSGPFLFPLYTPHLFLVALTRPSSFCSQPW